MQQLLDVVDVIHNHIPVNGAACTRLARLRHQLLCRQALCRQACWASFADGTSTTRSLYASTLATDMAGSCGAVDSDVLKIVLRRTERRRERQAQTEHDASNRSIKRLHAASYEAKNVDESWRRPCAGGRVCFIGIIIIHLGSHGLDLAFDTPQA